MVCGRPGRSPSGPFFAACRLRPAGCCPPVALRPRPAPHAAAPGWSLTRSLRRAFCTAHSRLPGPSPAHLSPFARSAITGSALFRAPVLPARCRCAGVVARSLVPPGRWPVACPAPRFPRRFACRPSPARPFAGSGPRSAPGSRAPGSARLPPGLLGRRSSTPGGRWRRQSLTAPRAAAPFYGIRRRQQRRALLRAAAGLLVPLWWRRGRDPRPPEGEPQSPHPGAGGQRAPARI